MHPAISIQASVAIQRFESWKRFSDMTLKILKWIKVSRTETSFTCPCRHLLWSNKDDIEPGRAGRWRPG
jgi:hypothetical protein